MLLFANLQALQRVIDHGGAVLRGGDHGGWDCVLALLALVADPHRMGPNGVWATLFGSGEARKASNPDLTTIPPTASPWTAINSKIPKLLKTTEPWGTHYTGSFYVPGPEGLTPLPKPLMFVPPRPILQKLDLHAAVADRCKVDLVSSGLSVMQSIADEHLSDSLAASPTSIAAFLNAAAAYATQGADVNVALTAVGMMWTVADILGKRLGEGKEAEEASPSGEDSPSPSPATPTHSQDEKEAEDEDQDPLTIPLTERLWLTLLQHLRALVDPNASIILVPSMHVRVNSGADASQGASYSHSINSKGFSLGLGMGSGGLRAEVRTAALQTLVSAISSHGSRLDERLWRHCVGGIFVPLVASITLATSAAVAEDVELQVS